MPTKIILNIKKKKVKVPLLFIYLFFSVKRMTTKGYINKPAP